MVETQRKFRARKDPFGAIFVLTIFAIGGFLLARGDLIPWPMADKFGWLFVVFGVLAAWDWWVTSYAIDQDQLVIRSGFSESRVYLCNLEEMQSRRSSLRIKCQDVTGSKWLTLLPKPKDRTAIVERLQKKCPWL